MFLTFILSTPTSVSASFSHCGCNKYHTCYLAVLFCMYSILINTQTYTLMRARTQTHMNTTHKHTHSCAHGRKHTCSHTYPHVQCMLALNTLLLNLFIHLFINTITMNTV